jgi:hypothetical protein
VGGATARFTDDDTVAHDGSWDADEPGSAHERRAPDSSSTSLPKRQRKSINRAAFFAQRPSGRAECTGVKVDQGADRESR